MILTNTQVEKPVAPLNPSLPDPFPPIVDERPQAKLVPANVKGQTLLLESDNVTVGRHDGTATLQIADHSLSLLHARIRWQNGRYWLYDEGSSTGTYLNNERLGLRPLPLSENDQIRFGRLRYQFLLSSEEE